MQYYSSTNQNSLTPMVKNLIIINGLFFLATMVAGQRGIDLYQHLALFSPTSSQFRPWQILTHFFMHGKYGQGGLLHIGMNMFGLFMFGRMLEVRWGPKRFLLFYMVTAFFAALLHFIVIQYQIQAMLPSFSASQIEQITNDGYRMTSDSPQWNALNSLINSPVVGASGAIFGILGACYVLFPNTILYLIFPPIPIKLKLAVTLYGLYELYRGVMNSPGDHVAHFAHLGGLVAGIIIVKYWNKTRRDSFF